MYIDRTIGLGIYRFGITLTSEQSVSFKNGPFSFIDAPSPVRHHQLPIPNLKLVYCRKATRDFVPVPVIKGSPREKNNIHTCRLTYSVGHKRHELHACSLELAT